MAAMFSYIVRGLPADSEYKKPAQTHSCSDRLPTITSKNTRAT